MPRDKLQNANSTRNRKYESGVRMRQRTLLLCLLLAGSIGSLLFSYRHATRWTPSFSITDKLRNASINAVFPLALNTSSTSSILLVSAYFPVSKSKHSLGEYRAWLASFLAQIESPIYFFTPPEYADIVREARPAHLPLMLNTSFSTPWDIPPMHGLHEAYVDMYRRDREAFRHSPELYAIWNSKPYLLEEGLRNAVAVMAPSNSGTPPAFENAFWVDAGSFRVEHRYAQWPSSARVREVFAEGSRISGTPVDDLIFFPVYRQPNNEWKGWTEDQGPIDIDFSEGSFFGGSPRAVAWWKQEFYAQHDKYKAAGFFVGKDQTLINALMFLHPKRFITVWIDQPKPTSGHSVPSTRRHCGPEWYYYVYVLSTPQEQEAMRVLWEIAANSPWAWPSQWFRWLKAKWMWIDKRGPMSGHGDDYICPVNDVLSVDRLLKTQFGSGWPVTHSRD
ncbi:hypothetical protein HGRIS_001985 [Hohenbuehelia grisea]|uniref:Uncharacterized protein n=1 Tax=Hohenbuehelia grisea TaxID=104357 RepID=A0ABR3JJV7_9AGAR